MDFVVAGFGLGAVIILLGFLICDLGPLWRRLRRAGPGGSHQRDWQGLCREVGASFIGGGIALCAITLVPLLLGVSDAAGARIVLATSVLVLAVAGVRAGQSVRRYRQWGASLPAWTPAAAQPLPPSKRDPVAAWPTPPKITAAQPAPSFRERPSAEPEMGETAELDEKASITGRFSSPLLRDIALNQDAGEGFRSEILADVAPAEPEPESPAGFRSPLLAAMVAEDTVASDGTTGAAARGETAVSEASQAPSDPLAEVIAADADQHDDAEAQPEAETPAATTAPLDRSRTLTGP